MLFQNSTAVSPLVKPLPLITAASPAVPTLGLKSVMTGCCPKTVRLIVRSEKRHKRRRAFSFMVQQGSASASLYSDSDTLHHGALIADSRVKAILESTACGDAFKSLLLGAIRATNWRADRRPTLNATQFPLGFKAVLFCNSSLQVVKMICSSCSAFLKAGFVMTSKSPLRKGPESEIWRNTSVVLVQCMIIIVRPGFRDFIPSTYLAVRDWLNCWSSSFALSAIGQP